MGVRSVLLFQNLVRLLDVLLGFFSFKATVTILTISIPRPNRQNNVVTHTQAWRL